jgi:pimeloyl-ACP methyl ester carboxylesterase
MPLLESADADIYFESHGEGEAVVFAHGMGGNHAIWWRQLERFARSYRVISFDHRGFGRSTDPAGRGRSAFVEDLRALLDHLGIERAALVGQSMGGGTCVGFCRKYPARVAALVLADTLHGIEESPAVAAIMERARTATRELPQLERVLGAAFRDANPAESFLYRQINSFNATDRHTLAGEWGTPCPPAELGATGVPVLFIAGSEDVLFPVEAIRLVQEAVDGSFLVEVSGAGHSAFWERPVEFNDSIASVLQMAGLKPRRPVHSNAPGYERLI